MPFVIPVFIPHEGCPHHCLFCNQHQVSGHSGPPMDAVAVSAEIRRWLDRRHPGRQDAVEVALYGGSFTALPTARQEELLGAVQPFLATGQVQSLRLSTRPDAIEPQGLALLARHGVTTMELGAQSCDDAVLVRSGRGHDSAAIVRAARLIQEAGFRLGLQLMLGLPGDTRGSLRRTVTLVIQLRPEFVRLYPVLVLRGTGLARLQAQGGYRPLSLSRAVALSAWAKKRFDDHGIQMVRMGLQPTAELEQALIAGPYHPAFGELVLARLMLGQTRRALTGVRGRVNLVIAARDRSIFQGQGKANLKRLRELGLTERFTLCTDPNQPRQTLRVEGGATGGL